MKKPRRFSSPVSSSRVERRSRSFWARCRSMAYRTTRRSVRAVSSSLPRKSCAPALSALASISGSSTAVSSTTGTKAKRSRRRRSVSSPRPSGRVRSSRTRSGVSASAHAAASVETCVSRQSHPSGGGWSAACARCACTGSSSTRRIERARSAWLVMAYHRRAAGVVCHAPPVGDHLSPTVDGGKRPTRSAVRPATNLDGYRAVERNAFAPPSAR